MWQPGQTFLAGSDLEEFRILALPARFAAIPLFAGLTGLRPEEWIALDAMPPRIDTRLLFPGDRGGHLNLHNWRADHSTPAVKAAGLEHRTPYALRHTFATFGIAAGVSLFELARFLGTSAEQIDKTYGHLLPDALNRTRGALDTFLAEPSEKVTRDA